MFSYSDEVITAHLQERRRHLLAEAAAYRLTRRQRRPGQAQQLSPLDRGLAAVGARLVAWGERLQANARRQVETQEIARA